MANLKKAYDSVRREIFYNVFIESGIPMKLVRVIKMCLTETCSRVRGGKNLSDMFPIRNGLKHVDALSPLLFNVLNLLIPLLVCLWLNSKDLYVTKYYKSKFKKSSFG